MREIKKIIYDDIVKHFDVKEIKNINILQQKNIGVHIVDSPRFICEMYLAENDKTSLKKIFIKNRPNVHEEFNNMKFLWESHYFNSEKYVIPRPIFLDEENSLLFMECYDGEEFLRAIYKNVISFKKNFSKIEEYISNAASWLLDFQSILISHVPEEKEFSLKYLLNFEENIQDFKFLSRKERERVVDKMKNIAKIFPKFRNSYIHDQYLFRNIIYCEDKICVVDFPHLRIGWPLYDFYTFYLGMDRLQQYPLISKSLCITIKDIFKSKYFENKKSHLERDTFESIFYFFIVSSLMNRYKRFRNIRGYLNDMFIKNVSNKLIEWSKI